MQELLERGIAELKRYLGEAAYQLLPAKLQVNEAIAFNFELPKDYLGIERTLRIGFPNAFPFLPLDFSITPSADQAWPHVMGSGVCLYGANQGPATSSPEAAVNTAMKQLAKLLKFSVADSDLSERAKEFSQEIRSYWATQLFESPNRFTLIKLPEVCCPLYVVSSNSSSPLSSHQYIGSNKYDDISRFESRYKRSRSKQKATAQPAYFLKLVTTPSNVIKKEDLLGWIEGHISDIDMFALKKWFKDTADLPVRWLILSLPTKVAALQGFVFTDPTIKPARKQPNVYGRRSTKRKFFPTKVNLNIQFAPIDVLDAVVIHQRTGPASSGLASKRIVVVGAGSLGGEVAVLLARSGIGHLYLVDDDKLEDVNLGRHTLGATELGKYKVEALADKICMDIPTVEIEFSRRKIQVGVREHTQALERADLVIVTTANWASEDYLWNLKSKGAQWGLIQAWSEPHGIIGHILTAPPGGNFDARYLFEEGSFVNKMSEWPEGGVYALPACGGSYIPGGPVALARIAGQTVQQALNQTIKPIDHPEWHAIVGNTKKITEYGGTYKGPDIPGDIESCEFNNKWPAPPASGGE